MRPSARNRRPRRPRPENPRRPPARTRALAWEAWVLARGSPGGEAARLLALHLFGPHVLTMPARAGARSAAGKGRERSDGFRRRTACFQSEFRGVREG